MTYEWTCCFDPHLSKLRAGERTTHSPHHGRCFDLLPQRCRSNTFGEAFAGKEFEPLKTSCNPFEIVISGAAATFSKRFANQVRCRSSPSAATSILVRNACDACPVSAQHWYALVICWDMMLNIWGDSVISDSLPRYGSWEDCELHNFENYSDWLRARLGRSGALRLAMIIS